MKYLRQAIRKTLRELVGSQESDELQNLPAPQIVEAVVPSEQESVVNEEPKLSVEDLEVLIPGATNKLPMIAPDVVKQFVTENPMTVNDYFLLRIKEAVANNLPEVLLFRLGESKLLAKLEAPKYEQLLKKLSEFYLKNEQYEKVDTCKKLLETHIANSIENVISESRTR